MDGAMTETLLEIIEEGRNPCQICYKRRKNWNECPYGEGKNYYGYFEIFYCPYQVMWIIGNDGGWPVEPSSYTEFTGRPNYPTSAPFTKQTDIIAEVEIRLERTGIHGKLLREQIFNGKTKTELDPEAHSALMYCSGFTRRRMPFYNWLADRKYRAKKR